MSSSDTPRKVAALIWASSITKIHPGAGRSPGVVDLPVVRDPLGIWYIPGSQLKGSLKTKLAVERKCIADKGENEGGIKCDDRNECKDLCCILGPDVRKGEEGISKIALTDLYPILVPAPSAGKGVVYVTGYPLIAWLNSLLSLTGKTGITGITESDQPLIVYRTGGEGGEETVYIQAQAVEARKIANNELVNLLEEAAGISSGSSGEPLNPLYETIPLDGRILILPTTMLKVVLNSLLDKRTRVSLDKKTKTTGGSRGLWTEEYIPWGTLFVGAAIDTGFSNKYCENTSDNASNNPFNILRNVGYIVVGGKETVGAGLLKIKIQENNSESVPAKR